MAKYSDQRLTKAQQKKAKPANQGGGPNYLGKQETVTVPKKWLSSPDHVVAELAYITPREQKILLDADLYGSLKGKPNRGPGGIMSLQGDLGGYDASPGGPNDRSNDGPVGRGPDKNKQRAADIMTGRVSVNSPTGGTEGYRGPGSKKSALSKAFSPRNIFTGLLGLVNPAFGLLSKAFSNIDIQGLRGYNPDGTPKTQEQYEQDRLDKQLQGRLDKMYDRKTLGKNFSQKNMDMLEAMGLAPSTAQNVLTGRDLNLRGILNSGVPKGVAPMDVNVPSGIQNIDVGYPSNDLMAGLTKMQQKMLAGPQKNLKNIMGISDQEILNNISPFNDPNDPATLEEVQSFYTT